MFKRVLLVSLPIFLIVVSLGFFLYKNSSSNNKEAVVQIASESTSQETIPEESVVIPTIEPTEVPITVVPTEQPVLVASKLTQVNSPDGKKKLVMERVVRSDGPVVYNFYTADANGENKLFIFTKTMTPSESMQIVLNSWSPDNKYVFVSENSSSGKSYYVLRGGGGTFADGSQYMDVVPIFNSKGTGNILTEVTGWDSDTLLHVFSNKTDGSRGSSYWFEVPSGAVMQIAGR